MIIEMETVSTKVQPDVVEHIEEYQQKNNISKSEAVRRLIQNGLEAEEQDDIKTELDGINRSLTLLNERMIEEKNKTESYRQDARGKRSRILTETKAPRGFTETLKSIFKLR